MTHKRVHSEGGFSQFLGKTVCLKTADLEESEGKSTACPHQMSYLSNSMSISSMPCTDGGWKPSKAYADAMKSLQSKIKRLEHDRDEAKLTAQRLEQQLSLGDSSYSRLLRQTEDFSSSKDAKLREILRKTNKPSLYSAECNVSAEVIRATKGLKDNIKELSEALVLIKAECREKNAKWAVAEEKCEKIAAINRDLMHANAELKAKCGLLEENLSIITSEKRGLVSAALFNDLTGKTEQLEANNEMLQKRLRMQEEFCEGQKSQIGFLTEQIREMKRTHQGGSRVVSFPHSPAEASTPQMPVNPRRANSQKSILSPATISLDQSFADLAAEKLRKEIKRYQCERNRLEISTKEDRQSRTELRALKRLIRSKSKQLRRLSA